MRSWKECLAARENIHLHIFYLHGLQTLYTFPQSFRAYKSRVAAAYSGFNLKVVELSAADKSRTHVPCFETEDKKVRLHEANAILKARLEAINQQSAYRRAL